MRNFLRQQRGDRLRFMSENRVPYFSADAEGRGVPVPALKAWVLARHERREWGAEPLLCGNIRALTASC